MVALLKFIFLSLGIALLQIIVEQNSFTPLMYINTIFISIVWLIFYRSSPRVLWVAVGSLSVLDLFSAKPFGCMSGSLLLTFALVSWFHIRIFTDHSLLTLGLMGISGMVVYRFFFVLIMNSIDYHQGANVHALLLKEWFFEVVWTVASLCLVYALTGFFMQRFKPYYVRKS
jgi:hypothetical protein